MNYRISLIPKIALCTHRFGRKFSSGVLPSRFSDFPCWLGDKGRESKPIIILVFLEVGKSNHQEVIKQRGVAFGDYVVPDLRDGM